MSFKTSIKDFIPPFVLRRVRPLKRNIKRFFEGRGEDWIVLTQGPLEGLELFRPKKRGYPSRRKRQNR